MAGQQTPRTRVEWQVLDLLLEHGSLRIGQFVELVGSAAIVAEAIEALQAAGLVTRTGVLVRLAGAPPLGAA